MGCGGSKSPDVFLVRQISPEHIIIEGALVESNYLELHGRVDKSSSLTTVLENVATPAKPPLVEVWQKPDGAGVVVQIAKDTWSFPTRDPVVTFFDAAGKPMAALVFQSKHLQSTGDGRPVLYARGIPARTDRVHTLNDMVGGHSLGEVKASLTTADGAVMPCVGIIHRMYTGFLSELALYRVEGDGFVTSNDQIELMYRAGADKEVTNAKGEGVAYKTLDDKKVFVAAGADAVLSLALIAATEVNKKFEVTHGQAAGGGGGGG